MTPELALNAARSMLQKAGLSECQAGNVIDNIMWASEYADGRKQPKRGIAIGDWNEPYDYKTRKPVPGGIMRRLGNILERMGVELEWCDMVSTCHDCGRVIQTEPDCYSWQPEFEIGDGAIVCTDCVDPEEYLSRLADDHGFNSIGSIDPSEHGYVRLNESPYESGWHPGQTDDPRKVEKQLTGLGLKRFLFHKDEQSQFYSTWSVFVPAPEPRDDDDDDDAGRSCADPQPSDHDDV